MDATEKWRTTTAVSVSIMALMDASSAVVCAAVAKRDRNTSEDTVSPVVGRFVGANVGLAVGTPQARDPAAEDFPGKHFSQEVAWAPPGE